jgi:hypothetical protein
MKPIPLVRFNALAGYARAPMARITGEELGWFENDNGRIVGALIRDRTDDDFGGIVFAQDQRLRFRAVDVSRFESTPKRALASLRRAMEREARALPTEHHQGDERGHPVDFFASTHPDERLNPNFVRLAESEGYSPARQIIEPMMRWYEDADGNFVEQFQTTGFDQRMWELYLFAAFTEMEYQLDRSVSVPDFLCAGLRGKFSVEAVTVGPTVGKEGVVAPPPLTSPESIRAYLRNYMPIKFGSALFSKLQKVYWERSNVAGKPLLFAIEDFSSPASMTHSRSALETYLYGYEYEWEHDAAGILRITPRKIEIHQWGEKTIPSSFFNLPGAENIGAVLFSNSGTIAKFNRMGIVGGFGSPRVLVVREGTSYNHDPNAAAPNVFRRIVNAPDYVETWVEGLDVFHNPRALIPVEEHAIPGAAHHYIADDGRRVSHIPDWHPLGSLTKNFVPVDVQAALRALAASEPDRSRGDL